MRFTRIAALLFFAGACTRAEAPTPAPEAARPAAPAPEAPPTAPAPPPRGDDADRKSKNGRLETEVAGVPLVVQYGRPAVRGRTIFGDVVPYGEVWRTGADEATTITFQAPALVAGKPVAPGTYALFTIPGPDRWTLILNEPPQQWGAYKYDASKDVLRVEVGPEKTQGLVEELTFEASGDGVAFAWADTRVRLPIARP